MCLLNDITILMNKTWMEGQCSVTFLVCGPSRNLCLCLNFVATWGWVLRYITVHCPHNALSHFYFLTLIYWFTEPEALVSLTSLKMWHRPETTIRPPQLLLSFTSELLTERTTVPPQARVQLCVYSLTSVDNSGYLKRLKHCIFCLSHKTTIDVPLICLQRAPEHNICPIFCSAYCLKSSLREFLAVTAMILGYAQSYLEFISKLQWKKEKWK